MRTSCKAEEMYAPERAASHPCPRSSTGELSGTVLHSSPSGGLGEGTASLNSFESAIKTFPLSLQSPPNHIDYYPIAIMTMSLVLSSLWKMKETCTSAFPVLQPESHLMDLFFNFPYITNRMRTINMSCWHPSHTINRQTQAAPCLEESPLHIPLIFPTWDMGTWTNSACAPEYSEHALNEPQANLRLSAPMYQWSTASTPKHNILLCCGYYTSWLHRVVSCM